MAVSEVIGQEASFLGVSVLLGTGMFLLYDCLRILRRVIPHGTIWIGIEDFLYWMVCTAAVFVMLYTQNDGKIRGYAIGGVVVGMLLYYGLLSRFVIRLNVLVLKALFGTVGKVVSVIFHPFCFIGKKIHVFFRKQLKKVWKAIKIGISKH